MPQNLDRRELFGRLLKPVSSAMNEAILPSAIQEPINSGEIITRRGAIRTSAAVITGVTLLMASGNTPEVQAQFSTWPFQARPEWSPLDPNQGPTLHAVGGPLDIFDQTYGTRVRKYFEDYARWALSESDEAQAIIKGEKPDMRKFWGFCSAAAVAGREIAKQRALGLSEQAANSIYQGPAHKWGVLTAYHAGFTHFRPDLYDIKGNIDYFIKGLKDQGNAFIGNLGAGDEPWFYNVHAISDDEQTLTVTGIGKNSVSMKRSALKFAYIPESLEESIANGRSEYIQGENKIFRHPELTKERAYEFAGLI